MATATGMSTESERPTPPPRAAAALGEVSRLHARGIREPIAAQPEIAAWAAAWPKRRVETGWRPLVTAALANARAANAHRRGRFDDARTTAERTLCDLAALRPPPTPDSAAWHDEHTLISAAAERLLAVVCDDQGDHSAALPHHRAAIALYERRGDRLNQAKQWHNLSVLYARSQLFEEALSALRRSTELQEGFDDPGRFRAFMSWLHTADVLLEMGDATGAANAAREAIAATVEPGPASARGEPFVTLGRACLRLGRIAEAEAALAEAQRRFEAIGDRIGQAKALAGLAQVRRDQSPADAVAALAEAVATAAACGARTEAAQFRCELASALLAAGDPARALVEARAALEQLPKGAAGAPIAAAAWQCQSDALAALGEAAAALQAHREFHARFVAVQERKASLRAAVLAARHRLDLAQRDTVRARLEAARLNEALARIAARLAAIESAPPGTAPQATTAAAPSGPEALRPLGLRPRECEVLYWAIEGKSNEEIGIILGCGAETVKTHLKRIYAQLDVTNRTSATSVALRRLRSAS